MAASCLIPPNGHQKVLKAFTDVARKLNRGVSGSERFRPIIDGLLFGDENYKVKIGCMMLANAIVSTPGSLDFRMHLRNELIREGFNLGLEVGKVKIEREKFPFILYLVSNTVYNVFKKLIENSS